MFFIEYIFYFRQLFILFIKFNISINSKKIDYLNINFLE